jgi:hypothetical protein
MDSNPMACAENPKQGCSSRNERFSVMAAERSADQDVVERLNELRLLGDDQNIVTDVGKTISRSRSRAGVVKPTEWNRSSYAN